MSDSVEMRAMEPQEISTTWKRIADEIAGELTRGAYSSGEALPPAQDLARQYGVHRHTVRQAYRHLQDLGLVNIQQGRGTFATGTLLPYRIGRRVSFRENLKAFDLEAQSRIIASDVMTASPEVARELGLTTGTALWYIRMANEADSAPLSLSTHYLACKTFPDLPRKLLESGGSFTKAFLSFGIKTYERLSTRISGRLATPEEADLLDAEPYSVLLTAKSIDSVQNQPLQWIETAFRADRIELLVEND
jgi:GntR family transcriptional regulator, phosphonate transport system regulatory protein